MDRYLILKLQGVLQAWGGHTYETFRPTEVFPTRSGLIGLLGACLGIRRSESARLSSLAESFSFAARADRHDRLSPSRTEDFHTVQQVRTVGGKPKATEITRRQYLMDAAFTVALRFVPGAAFGLDQVAEAVQAPGFMPYLGRKSCPLGRPLLEAVVEADSLRGALAAIPPGGGTVYSEEPGQAVGPMRVRDVPLFGGHRRFETRSVYVYPMEASSVSE